MAYISARSEHSMQCINMMSMLICMYVCTYVQYTDIDEEQTQGCVT